MLRPYEALGNAIVMQAVTDYRKAGQMMAKGKAITACHEERKSIVKFINSKWFILLTEVKPELLLKQLHEEECQHDAKRIFSARL
mgnify:CR=1 FL=1